MCDKTRNKRVSPSTPVFCWCCVWLALSFPSFLASFLPSQKKAADDASPSNADAEAEAKAKTKTEEQPSTAK